MNTVAKKKPRENLLKANFCTGNSSQLLGPRLIFTPSFHRVNCAQNLITLLHFMNFTIERCG